MASALKKRTRLSPHNRRMQLLDSAAQIIQEKGLSRFTMDALAKHAGVSNPLTYKYFDTRLSLLQELFVREAERFYRDIWERLEKTQQFREFVRIVVAVNFEEVSTGNILGILRNQPDVKDAWKERESVGARKVGRVLVDRMCEAYEITPGKARKMVIMGSGASQAMAERFSRDGGDKENVIDETVQFIFAGIESAL